MDGVDAGATVTFLLRSPATFDGDEDIQKHVKSGKARLLKGDALVEEDVRNAWNEATKESPVDLVIFTVGFSTSCHSSSECPCSCYSLRQPEIRNSSSPKAS